MYKINTIGGVCGQGLSKNVLKLLSTFVNDAVEALAICNIVPIFIIKNSNKGEKG